jgi:hypothetical protein
LVTTSGSAAGTSEIHCTDVGDGLLAVGGVLSIAVMVWVTLIVFPHASVTRYILVAIYGLAAHPAPPLLVLLNKVTTGVLQLSASVVTIRGSGAGISVIHCTAVGAGLLAVGGV